MKQNNTEINSFDQKAGDWDKRVMLQELSGVVAAKISKVLPEQAGSGLELGCGTGLLGLKLVDKFSKLTFVDSSAKMLEMLGQKINEKGLLGKTEILQLDIDEAELPQKYDCIFSQLAFHHLHNIEEKIKMFAGKLKPGGFLFIADLVEEDGSFHGETVVPHHGFSGSSLAELLEQNGLSASVLENIFTIEKPVQEVLKKFPIFVVAGQKEITHNGAPQ
jgi:predicted TPR repeat methyltransferase